MKDLERHHATQTERIQGLQTLRAGSNIVDAGRAGRECFQGAIETALPAGLRIRVGLKDTHHAQQPGRKRLIVTLGNRRGKGLLQMHMRVNQTRRQYRPRLRRSSSPIRRHGRTRAHSDDFPIGPSHKSIGNGRLIHRQDPLRRDDLQVFGIHPG